MSKAKDFDSNFVSGAYEVNKERDKRRTRRMQKIKHKKKQRNLLSQIGMVVITGKMKSVLG